MSEGPDAPDSPAAPDTADAPEGAAAPDAPTAPDAPDGGHGTALVLGGGGFTAMAWEIGVLKGLSDAGCDLTAADLVVGTSAGAVLGARITAGSGRTTCSRRRPTGRRTLPTCASASR